MRRKRHKKHEKINKKIIISFAICFLILIAFGVKVGEVLAYKMMEKGKEETAIAENESKMKVKDDQKMEEKKKDEELLTETKVEKIDDNEDKEDKLTQPEEIESIEKDKEEVKENEEPKAKVAYLTFDDGPSIQVTPQILDILKKYNVKATFFVIGNAAESNSELVKRTHVEGHAIGNHSYSHNYKYLYSNVDNFMTDIRKNEQVLKNILGPNFKTNLVRFPGGSFGEKKNPFKIALEKQGYNYIDWNALNGDAEGHHIPKDRLVQRLKTTSGGKSELIILMHDLGTKQTTVDALPEIIEYLRNEGYEFHTLE